MPGRPFSLDLHRASQYQHPNKTSSLPNSAKTSPTAESPGPSMKKSFAFLKKHGSSDKKDKNRADPIPQNGSVTLAMQMESPPAIFHGAPSSSSGALISGRLQLTPKDRDVTMASITMYLEAIVTTKKPVANQCPNCTSKVDDLSEWNFIKHPKTFHLAQGTQDLPFSHLIPGHLPPTTHGGIASLEYSLHVRAKTDRGEEIQFRKELLVQRALRPGLDRTSDRVFSDTSLKINVRLPNVIHPIGDFPVQWRLEGTINKHEGYQLRWYVRYVEWTIEEKESTISPACAKHANKVGGEGKGIGHEVVREIAKGEHKEGWKTSNVDGHVEGEFTVIVNSPKFRPQCEMEAQSGLKIEHSLVLELVIGEVHSSDKKPDRLTSTGVAKRLRTRFGLPVTERGGMGISWDEERPPNYTEVPPSPPHYQGLHTQISDEHAEDLHNDIERYNLNDR